MRAGAVPPASRRASLIVLPVALALAAPVGAKAADIESLDGRPVPAASTAAATAFERVLPAAVASSSAARVDDQVSAPTLTVVGDHLSAVGALGNPTIAVDPANGFALDTRLGALTISPTWVDSGASVPVLVNGDTALFADIEAGVDAVLRPTAAGVATVAMLRNGLSPRTVAWSVHLPRGQKLRALPDGGVAILAAHDPGTPGLAVGHARKAEAIAESTLSDPAAQYHDARERAQDAAASGNAVAVVHPPTAQDAAGRPVAATLDVHGDVITLTLDHPSAAQYPVAADLSVSAPDAWERPWREAPGTGTAQPGPDGLLKVLLPDGQVLLTHGPDYEPRGHGQADEGLFDPGLPADDLGQDDPVEPLDRHSDATAGGGDPAPSVDSVGPVGLPPIPAGDPVCASPGTKRLQIMYSSPRPLGDPTRKALVRRIRRIVKGMNVKLYGEAQASGDAGTSARYQVVCDASGRISVVNFEDEGSNFENVVSAAKRVGATDRNTKYLIFEETPSEANDSERLICGEGNFYDDERPTRRNLNNGRRGVAQSGAGNSVTSGDDALEGGYGVVYGQVDGDEECWNVDNAMHENGHTMGAVQNNAPESTTRGHCNDGIDLMCYDDREPEDITNGVPSTYREDACPLGPRGDRFDCNYDTYFDAQPEPGEYLDDHWNLGRKQNVFLDFRNPRKPVEAFAFYGTDGHGEAGIHTAFDDGTGRYQWLSQARTCDGCTGGATPALSPDAQDILLAGEGSSTQCTDIEMMNTDGSDLTSLYDCSAHGYASGGNPRFSPSGRTVIFDAAGDLRTMGVRGDNEHRLTDWQFAESQPAISPDGESVALSSNGTPGGAWLGVDPDVGGRSAIYRIDRDGSNPVQLTQVEDFPRAEHPRFSPDGTQIAFQAIPAGGADFDVYVMRTDGADVRKVAGPGAFTPDWTPAGEVVYAQQRADLSTDIVAAGAGANRRTLVGRLAGTSDPAFRQASPLYYP